MGSLDFNNFPQQPLYLEDNRSPEEKQANARLLEEKRVMMLLKRVAWGIFIGLIVGASMGWFFCLSSV